MRTSRSLSSARTAAKTRQRGHDEVSHALDIQPSLWTKHCAVLTFSRAKIRSKSISAHRLQRLCWCLLRTTEFDVV